MPAQVDNQSSMFAFPSLGGADNFTRQEDGTVTISNYPVFRVGTFRDSKGKEVTYDRSDLHAMADNFKELREDFPNPPVREDHTRSIKSVVGYVENLTVRDDDVLVADFSLTEPKAVERWERKTYRGRSSEIGAWRVSKDEVKSPFFLGFAFVDIPAVTRLFGASETDTSLYMEAQVPETNTITEPVTANTVTTGTGTSADFGTVTYSNGVVPVLHAFTVGGVEETDYEAVQAHIDQLEQFAAEQRDTGRAAFVTKLVKENRLAAPQMDAMIAFAKTLADDQFVQWSEAMSNAAPIAAFAGSIVGGTDSEQERSSNVRMTRLADAQETVRMHRLAGMDEEILQTTDSFKLMTSLQQEEK